MNEGDRARVPHALPMKGVYLIEREINSEWLRIHRQKDGRYEVKFFHFKDDAIWDRYGMTPWNEVTMEDLGRFFTTDTVYLVMDDTEEIPLT